MDDMGFGNEHDMYERRGCTKREYFEYSPLFYTPTICIASEKYVTSQDWMMTRNLFLLQWSDFTHDITVDCKNPDTNTREDMIDQLISSEVYHWPKPNFKDRDCPLVVDLEVDGDYYPNIYFEAKFSKRLFNRIPVESIPDNVWNIAQTLGVVRGSGPRPIHFMRAATMKDLSIVVGAMKKRFPEAESIIDLLAEYTGIDLVSDLVEVNDVVCSLERYQKRKRLKRRE